MAKKILWKKHFECARIRVTDSRDNLIKTWRSDAAKYQAQVEEARKKGTPNDQMLASMTTLRQCANELERAFRIT